MEKTERYRLGTGFLLMVILSASVVTPAVTQESALDPVVLDVVEMLAVGVDEGVIVQWLESTGRRPADVGREDMITLTEAGASELLVTALLMGVESPNDSPDAVPDPAVEEAASAGPTPTSPDVEAESVESRIQLRVKQAFVDEDEPDAPRSPPWGVYLYLDGELVAWTLPSLKAEPVESRRLISAGSHELRVVLQRYEDLRRGWLYESRSVPTLIAFQARPGTRLEIEVEMKRIWGLWRERKDGGPLSYVVRQGVEVLAEHAGTGGDPDRWQPVCEDVEANFPESLKVPRQFRGAMHRCVRWADLWSGKGQSTSRSAILTELEKFDFEPPSR